MDFNFVNSRLATGAHVADGNDAGALVAAGITAIIDCTDEGDDTPLFVPYGQCHVLFNPTADDGTHKDSSWFKASSDFALPLLAQPGQKIYAHCSSGINRGPSTLYYLLRCLGWDSATAEQMIRTARPVVGLAYKADADAAIAAIGF